MLLTGKNAIITGSRRGIGRATVEVFAQNGANVWACAREKDDSFEEDMQTISAQYGVWVKPVYFDITNEQEIKDAVREILKDKLPIDALVNNAGIAALSTTFQMTSMDKIKDVFNTNFFGQILLTQYISRVMAKQRRGSIVNIVSIAALDGDPAQLEYAASKAALVGTTKKLSIELGCYNIRVNAVAPGIIATDMGMQIQQEFLQRTLDKSVMKRMGKPEEIADVIMFLASDLASYITGQVIRVDGGM